MPDVANKSIVMASIRKAQPWLSFLFMMICCTATAQLPTAKEIFRKMKESVEDVRTISYQLDYRNVNRGQEDSVFWSSSKTWVQRVPGDTIFGAFFHVQQKSKNGTSDYYYDGINAMDIYHTSRHPELGKTVTVITPRKMGNGYNAVQSRTTVRGYSEDLLSKEINPRWVKYLDSMEVKDAGGEWLLQWTQTDPADDYLARWEVRVDKGDGLIRSIRQHSTWHSVPLNQDVVITHVKINDPEDGHSAQLTDHYEGYVVKYDTGKKQSNATASASLVGTVISEFSYPAFDGHNITLRPQKGKYLLLDFWETWCGYCFLAMPSLKKLHEEYGSKGLQVVGVVMENKEQVGKIVKAKAFPYPTVFADEKLKHLLRLEGRPRYVLIDDAGKIVADEEGNLDRMKKKIMEILK
jgi:thiol-disulfide isomerase/thioredoxin